MAQPGTLRHAPAGPMAHDSRTITLRGDDIAAFRTSVIACAHPSEAEHCERLLGQLASLEARGTAGTIRFVPGRRTAPLARRALAHLQQVRRAHG
jgi:hypothetical protein